MDLTLLNILYFAGRLGPIMLVFFFVLLSIFNQDWKGIIYLSGVIMSCFLAIILSATGAHLFDNSAQESGLCEMTGTQLSKFPLSSVTIGFTIIYMIFPMFQMAGSLTNPLALIVMLAFTAVDVFFLVSNTCTRIVNTTIENPMIAMFIPIVLAYLIGGVVAYIYVLIGTSNGNSELLYFGNKETGPFCKLRGPKMRCKVYQNGELVTAM